MTITTSQLPSSCPEHGPFLATVRTIGASSFSSQCPTCSDRQAYQIKQREQAERLQKLLAAAEVPPRYSAFDASLLKPTVIAWIDQAPSPSSLILMGRPGCGKTSNAACALLNLAHRGVHVSFKTCKGVIEHLLGCRSRNAESFSSSVNGFVRPAVLLLDDYTAFPEWHCELLQAVVEARYAARKPTVLTTNLTQQQFVGLNLLARQTWDRLKDKGFICLFRDDSYRNPHHVASE